MKFSVIEGNISQVYGVKADAIAISITKYGTHEYLEMLYKMDKALGYKGSYDSYKKEYLRQYLAFRRSKPED